MEPAIPRFEDSYKKFKDELEKIKSAKDVEELSAFERRASDILSIDLLILVNQLGKDLAKLSSDRRHYLNDAAISEIMDSRFHDTAEEEKPKPKSKKRKKSTSKKKSTKKAKK